jgi:hypothetical protein
LICQPQFQAILNYVSPISLPTLLKQRRFCGVIFGS